MTSHCASIKMSITSERAFKLQLIYICVTVTTEFSLNGDNFGFLALTLNKRFSN